MKRFVWMVPVLVCLVMIPTFSPARAQMGEMSGHGKKADMGRHPGSKMERGKMGAGGGHLFGPTWRDTLSEEQKVRADRMHLDLKKEKSVLESRIRMKKAELNGLILQDRPDMKEVQKQIGEIAELKKAVMLKKYAHMAEMRAMLTPEQRVSFDMGVLSMGGGGHGGMGMGDAY